jgi:hypothetical protein
VREVIVNILSERQNQAAQAERDDRIPRGSRLKNKTGVNITDINVAKEIENNSKKRKPSKKPTTRRQPTPRRTKRKKPDIMGINSDQENEDNTDTDEEINIRQKLDLALEETSSIGRGNT